jgi:hypothetical protein
MSSAIAATFSFGLVAAVAGRPADYGADRWGTGYLWRTARSAGSGRLPGDLLMEAGTNGAVARKPWRESASRSHAGTRRRSASPSRSKRYAGARGPGRSPRRSWTQSALTRFGVVGHGGRGHRDWCLWAAENWPGFPLIPPLFTALLQLPRRFPSPRGPRPLSCASSPQVWLDFTFSLRHREAIGHEHPEHQGDADDRM